MMRVRINEDGRTALCPPGARVTSWLVFGRNGELIMGANSIWHTTWGITGPNEDDGWQEAVVLTPEHAEELLAHRFGTRPGLVFDEFDLMAAQLEDGVQL